jgi:hypothetical protein
MQKTSLLISILSVVMLIGATLGHGADLNGRNDARLNSAIEDFIRYQERQDYEGVWRLLSRSMRDGNHNDPAVYEKYLRSYGFHPGSFAIEKTVKTENIALVTVKVTYVDNSSGQNLGGALEEWRFVQENGSWFFDDYRTLNEFEAPAKKQ